MGRPTMKKKRHSLNGRTTDSKQICSPRAFDEDTTIFIDMSHDMREEGNKLFQKRDYEDAIIMYEKAIRLLPRNHTDVAYLRSNLAACYMLMSPSEYRQAINECNLALEVSPGYTKAFLKRARCFEAMNLFESACKDIDSVLALEPNNLTALEILDRIEKAMEKKGIKLDDKEMVMASPLVVMEPKEEKVVKKKKKGQKAEDMVDLEVKKICKYDKCESFKKLKPTKTVKLVFGEDVRCAQIPAHCTISQLMEGVRNRFPRLKSMLIKYKDKEGDMVTVTTSEELRWVVESADPQGSIRFYIVEADQEHEPLFEDGRKGLEVQGLGRSFCSFADTGSMRHYKDDDTSPCIDNWIIQFAAMFKNYVGFNSDAYLDSHELGMKLYSEAIEDVVTSEEAQEIFESAEKKFQELTALALFNWGNVHMSRARKRLFFPEDASKELILAQVKSAYEWAQGEYVKAGSKYEEAIKMMPYFYEGLIALGKQQFEQAKLSWCYAIGSEVDLDSSISTEVLELFNNAEGNMERGMEMWESIERQRVKNLSESNKEKDLLAKMGLTGVFKDISNDEAAEQASSMRSQINVLWGTMLYERSIVEFRLSLPTWEECLMAAIEKFKLAGSSETDLAVMVKNHIANETTQEGLGFKIDEIVQAWHEMYDAKRWIKSIPSFRLEPLFRRRVPKLHQELEHI